MQAWHKMRSQECRQHLSPIVLSLGGNIIVALIGSLVTARTSPGKYCNWFDMSVRLCRGLIGGKNNSLITTMMLLTFPCWRRRTWRSWTCRQRRPTHQTALRIIVWQWSWDNDCLQRRPRHWTTTTSRLPCCVSKICIFTQQPHSRGPHHQLNK